ncbi:MAG: hypothetical protein AAF974_00150 [Cyanobacteria bacterium P01_E01_bin.34]
MTTPSTPTSLATYLEGIQALHESGRYRTALNAIATALEHYPNTDALLLWEAIATNAIGETEKAISLVNPLATSGDFETRQQARYLSQIWSAPSLQRHDEWQVNMTGFNDRLGTSRSAYVTSAAAGNSAATKTKPSVTVPGDAPPSERPRSFWITLFVTGTLALAACNILLYTLRS